jgi:hypothetical protein
MKLIVPHVRGGEVWGGYGAEVQLYNLAKDPSETNNLASQPGFEPTVDRLAKLLDSWWKPGRERHSVKE